MMSLSLRRTLLGSGYIWRQTAGEIYSALTTTHCHFPGNIQTELPQMQSLLFLELSGKMMNAPLISVIASALLIFATACLMSWRPDHELGQGPPPLPTLSLHFTDLSKYLAGEKENQKCFMRSLKLCQANWEVIQRILKTPIYIHNLLHFCTDSRIISIVKTLIDANLFVQRVKLTQNKCSKR